MIASGLTDSIREFFEGLFNNFSSGWLLFSGPADIILMLVDVTVASIAIYFVLKLFNDSRAWQLLKGLLFLILISGLGNFLGLTTISYVLSRSLSALAIGFVVIFQPEFRRALETVGRRSLRIVDIFQNNPDIHTAEIEEFIEELVSACEHMSSEKTGALIILERRTKLGELLSVTSVVVDAVLSATGLEQIFYKGSPLHDGAVLVRDGRIYAARCHVPLADTYHMRRDLGTRHRAAIGASEIGDAISLVVSEETGKISLAVGGRLYPMENGDSLRVLLSRLLVRTDEGEKPRSFFKKLERETEAAEAENRAIDKAAGLGTSSVKKKKRHQLHLKMLSIVLGLMLWAYIQVMENPVKETGVSDINIQITGVEKVSDAGLDFSTGGDNLTTVRFAVREKYLNKINRGEVSARLDFNKLDIENIMSELDRGKAFVRKDLPLDIKVNGLGESAYDVLVRDPSEVTVFFSKIKASDKGES